MPDEMPIEPFSPYGVINLDDSSDDEVASPWKARGTIELPPAKDLTPTALARILYDLYKNPEEKDVEVRVMNILYCSTGNPSVLKNPAGEPHLFPEIGTYTKFLTGLKPGSKAKYMDELFTTLTPFLEKAVQTKMKSAYYRITGRKSSLADYLERQFDHQWPDKAILVKRDDSLEAPFIKPPITSKSRWTPEEVTMKNLKKVFRDTQNLEEFTWRRAVNLVHCAVGGTSVIVNPELCPETGSFAQSLTGLQNDARLECVKSLLKELGPLMTMSREIIASYADEGKFDRIEEYCKFMLRKNG